MKTESKLYVLVSPLDWGLGHATRCIPIIKALQEANCQVLVACHASAQTLLSAEFADVTFLSLHGYDIRYASSKRWFAAKILQQIPKIIKSVWREHRWLQKAVVEHNIDLVISDNRYGLFHHTVPCIFITHQLAIQTPFAWLSRWVQRLCYRFINRFTECWVPDYAGSANLASALSHPHVLPRSPVKYVGPLSRFRKEADLAITYKWLLLVSGPEPQRTIWEKALLALLPSLSGKVMLVRGLPGVSTVLPVPPHCEVFNHLPTADLQSAIARSEYVVSRSGYTTVMEMMALQKKTILVPTPGQTEQEYLANYLAQQGWCLACAQAELLPESMKLASGFVYQLPPLEVNSLADVVGEWVKRIGNK